MLKNSDVEKEYQLPIARLLMILTPTSPGRICCCKGRLQFSRASTAVNLRRCVTFSVFGRSPSYSDGIETDMVPCDDNWRIQFLLS